jgi:hypothetical protein
MAQESLPPDLALSLSNWTSLTSLDIHTPTPLSLSLLTILQSYHNCYSATSFIPPDILSNLRTLQCGSVVNFPSLSSLTKISKLCLENAIGTAEIQILKKLTQLVELGGQFGGEHVEELEGHLMRLTRLDSVFPGLIKSPPSSNVWVDTDVDFFEGSSVDPELLKRFPNLEELYLSVDDEEAMPEILEILSKMTKLTDLQLRQEVPDHVVMCLPRLTHLLRLKGPETTPNSEILEYLVDP